MFQNEGFTLVEVVVVTLIIAALALLVGPSFKNSTLTNQIEKAKIGLVELNNAVKLYNEVHSGSDTYLWGFFNDSMYDSLTSEDDQGYVYLPNAAGRWVHKQGSSTLYSLKDATAENGVLNCKYNILNPGNTEMASVRCKFNKIDEDGTECYKFFIESANPAVIKKVRYEENTNECDDL